MAPESDADDDESTDRPSEMSTTDDGFETIEVPPSHADRLRELRDDPGVEVDVDGELTKMVCQSIDDTYRDTYL
jgi:hypothetical protein